MNALDDDQRQTRGRCWDWQRFASLNCGVPPMPFRFVSVVLAAAPAAASVEPSPFMERLRAAHIVPADQCRPVLALAAAADALDISNKTIPEIDCSCFFAP